MGRQGDQGRPGDAGGAAGSILFGTVPTASMPSTDGAEFNYLPLGEAGTSVLVARSPNATIVLRDLLAQVDGPPGFGTSWNVRLFKFGLGGGSIGCDISGAFATKCDSGGQTLTLPAGSEFGVSVVNNDGAAPQNLTYGYRATTP